MKKNYINILVAVFLMTFLYSCEDETTYDIDWPVPTIESVSSYKAEFSTTITLQGNFKNVKSVKFGNVEGDNLQVAGNASSLTVDVPRTMDIDGAYITVTNEYKKTYQSPEMFVPVIPETLVNGVSEIQVGLTFTITGENVDLLTEILVNGEEASILSATPNTITVSVAGLSLKAGDLADIKFTSLAKNTIAPVHNVNVIYPFITYEEVVIWDFEDGSHADYSGEGTVSVESGDFMGETIKYFKLRAPGYGWDKATGEMTYTEVPDISGLVSPHLTFAVRTPAGSAGYFQMEDQAGNWRHFGYGFNTNGEWLIISEPLGDNWEGGEFNSGAFMPKLGFKAGNAGDKQDIDVAFVKITEGKYDGSQNIGDPMGGSDKPAKIVVMDFENANDWPDVMNGDNVVGSLTFRNDEIDAFYGNGFMTFVDDETIGLGSWGSYWGSTISKDVSSEDLSVFNDPHLSFALNSIDGEAQYVIVRMYQYDEKLVLIQKFFPNTYGDWQSFQFSLFNTDMENWSDASTELGAHYASLKRFNKDIPLDRIEVIVGRNDSYEIGVSIDEMVITEGPRF